MKKNLVHIFFKIAIVLFTIFPKFSLYEAEIMFLTHGINKFQIGISITKIIHISRRHCWEIHPQTNFKYSNTLNGWEVRGQMKRKPITNKMSNRHTLGIDNNTLRSSCRRERKGVRKEKKNHFDSKWKTNCCFSHWKDTGGGI